MKYAPVVLLAVLLMFSISARGAETTFTFNSETLLFGSSLDSSERNVSDNTYQSVIETDCADDANISATDEIVYTGEGSGTFPDDIDEKDDSYLVYIEEMTGSEGSSVVHWLRPNGDIQAQWTDVPDYGGTNFDDVDETGTADLGDQDTSIVYTATTSLMDIYSLTTYPSWPGNAEIDVQIFAVAMKTANPGANFQTGIRTGGYNWVGININPSLTWVNYSSTVWETNPYTLSEWTTSDIDNLGVFLVSNDASPTVECTKVVVKIWVNVTADYDYDLDVEINFDQTVNTTYTQSYTLNIQAKCSDSENFDWYIYNVTTTGWDWMFTITGTEDDDYSHSICVHERDTGSNGKVKTRIVDATLDETQSGIYIDYCVIYQTNTRYNASIQFVCTVTQDFNLTLMFEGYTSDGESWDIRAWNGTSNEWDILMTITTQSDTEIEYPVSFSDYFIDDTLTLSLNTTDDFDFDQSSIFIDRMVVIHTYEAGEPPITPSADIGQIVIIGLVIMMLAILLAIAVVK